MQQKDIIQLKNQCRVALLCNTDEVTVLYINLTISLLEEIERLQRQAGECTNAPQPG